MKNAYLEHVRATLAGIEAAGLTKRERVRPAPAKGTGGELPPNRNFCSNDYLGLARHPEIIRAAHEGLDRWGYGLASVRFISGTLEIHRELEARLSAFLQTEDSILYSSCFDANGGVFETLLGPEDAVISDELNHASIIDGIRLCKAQRFRYKNCDLGSLEEALKAAAGVRFRLIVTDGVFSMDGHIAPLREICDLAERYDALVMVDDSHAVGFIGKRGRGTPEHCGVMGRVDLLTGTLGKALGGASGGYVSGKKEIVELLRQRSRPYLFSNSLAPMIAAASCAALDLVSGSTALRDRLEDNTRIFRTGMARIGLKIPPGIHPIIPVMLGEAGLALRFATRVQEKGIHVSAFSYPVVPQGTARIRTQVSASHSTGDLEAAVDAFAEVKRELAG